LVPKFNNAPKFTKNSSKVINNQSLKATRATENDPVLNWQVFSEMKRKSTARIQEAE